MKADAAVMAEFKCYECSKMVRSGEKFTFTKQGCVHFDCFVASRRRNIQEEKLEHLNVLSALLESELEHMINLYALRSNDEGINKALKNRITEIQKQSGETTRLMSEL